MSPLKDPKAANGAQENQAPKVEKVKNEKKPELRIVQGETGEFDAVATDKEREINLLKNVNDQIKKEDFLAAYYSMELLNQHLSVDDPEYQNVKTKYQELVTRLLLTGKMSTMQEALLTRLRIVTKYDKFGVSDKEYDELFERDFHDQPVTPEEVAKVEAEKLGAKAEININSFDTAIRNHNFIQALDNLQILSVMNQRRTSDALETHYQWMKVKIITELLDIIDRDNHEQQLISGYKQYLLDMQNAVEHDVVDEFQARIGDITRGEGEKYLSKTDNAEIEAIGSKLKDRLQDAIENGQPTQAYNQAHKAFQLFTIGQLSSEEYETIRGDVFKLLKAKVKLHERRTKVINHMMTGRYDYDFTVDENAIEEDQIKKQEANQAESSQEKDKGFLSRISRFFKK